MDRSEDIIQEMAVEGLKKVYVRTGSQRSNHNLFLTLAPIVNFVHISTFVSLN